MSGPSGPRENRGATADDTARVLLPLAVLDPRASGLHQVFHPGQGATGQAFATGQAVVTHTYPDGISYPPAWKVAFDSARSGDANAGQDMLMGINAHVQRDMPFVVATVGIRTPSGATRKPDHDVVNAIA